MKRLEIQPDVFILLDDEDLEWVSRERWYAVSNKKTFTRKIRKSLTHIERKSKTPKPFLASLIVPHDPKTHTVVYRDGNGLNLQKSNLLVLDRSTFEGTNPRPIRSNSGFRGVTWVKGRQCWQVQITSQKIQYNLGRFKSLKEAALTYNKKALDLYGDNAFLNDVDSLEGKLTIDMHSGLSPQRVPEKRMRKARPPRVARLIYKIID